MTRDDVMRLARECGDWNGQTCEMNDVGLMRFAVLVAAAEREECADLLESNAMACREESMLRLMMETNAAAIRARGQA